MKKSFVIGLILMMLMSYQVFAENQSSGELLYELGLIEGNGQDLGEHQDLKEKR